jgi:hypothetical protein
MRRAVAVAWIASMVAVLVGAGGSGVPAGAATSECDAGVCTVTFAYSGAPETWTVPAGVTTAHLTIAGASGGSNWFGPDFGEPGGRGGRLEVDVPVVGGSDLTIVVGQAGADGSYRVGGVLPPPAAAFGGGGPGGAAAGFVSIVGGGGGGGSFVFGVRPDATTGLLAAAGGGGGGGGPAPGGVGGSDGEGGSPAYSPAASGGGGTSTAGGVAGGDVRAGTSGTGPSTDASTLGQGGAGPPTDPAGGGGGGYFGGGSGGFGWVFDPSPGIATGAGGGGSGFVLPQASVTGTGTNSGDGSVVVTYSLPPTASATSLTATQPDGTQVGDPVVLTATVASEPSGGPTPTGLVRFYEDGELVDPTGIALDDGTARVTVDDPSAGSHSYRAEYLGDGSYAPSSSATVDVVVHALPSSTTTSSTTTTTTAATSSPTSAGSGTAAGGGSGFASTGAELGRPVGASLAALALGVLLVGLAHLRRARARTGSVTSTSDAPRG